MKTRKHTTLGLVAAGLLALPLVAAGDVGIAPLERVVAVEDVHSSGAEVSGLLVNQTDDQLENVRLMVSDQFFWRDEFHPGPESPGDGQTFVVRGPIPPRGSVPFHFERPAPLPSRSDGDFTTQVSVLELTHRPVVPGTTRSAVEIERPNTIERTE